MKIEAILFANAAMVNEQQLLVVDGGGWKYVEPAGFPMTLAGSICGVIGVELEDFGATHELAGTVFDDSGQVDGSSGSITVDAREESEQMTTPRFAFAIPFVTVVRGPTVLKASVTSNGAVLGGLSVIVRRAKPADGS